MFFYPQFMTFLERLGRAFNMEEISKEIGVDLHTESLLIRAEQLARLESDKLIDKVKLDFKVFDVWYNLFVVSLCKEIGSQSSTFVSFNQCCKKIFCYLISLSILDIMTAWSNHKSREFGSSMCFILNSWSFTEPSFTIWSIFVPDMNVFPHEVQEQILITFGPYLSGLMASWPLLLSSNNCNENCFFWPNVISVNRKADLQICFNNVVFMQYLQKVNNVVMYACLISGLNLVLDI